MMKRGRRRQGYGSVGRVDPLAPVDVDVVALLLKSPRRFLLRFEFRGDSRIEPIRVGMSGVSYERFVTR